MPDASSADSGFEWKKRFCALWPTKLGLTVVLSAGFWSFYLYLSRHAFVPVHLLPITMLDKWAGFQPYPWAWVYESNFLITGIIPWMMTTRAQLRRYAGGFLLLAGVSFAIFALFPVAAPRPAGFQADPALLFITQVDGPLNAFPSLHAGSLVFTLALAHRLFGRRVSAVTWCILWLWALLILFATLATKQHYAVDLLAGIMLGLIADWFAWRD